MSQTPHLSPEELITAGRGEPLAPSSAGHLATCGECTGEAGAWNAVAGGMRVLAARSTLPDYIIDRALTGTVRHKPRRHGHAWLAAAAAAVLLAGGGYGLSRALGPAGGGNPAARADVALTATGCSALKATAGTLTSVSGSTLTIRAAGGGLVTVTTSADTKVIREVAGTLSDIKVGTQLTVFGSKSGEAIDAKTVTLRNGTAPSLPKSPVGPGGRGGLAIQLGVVSGTVTDSAGSRLTVDETDGSRVQVITSPDTTVLALAASSIGQMRTGELTSAVGAPGPNGTLAATMVEQDALTVAPAAPSGPQGLPAPGSGAVPALTSPPAQPSLSDPSALFSGLGCAQDAIATTYLMALAG